MTVSFLFAGIYIKRSSWSDKKSRAIDDAHSHVHSASMSIDREMRKTGTDWVGFYGSAKSEEQGVMLIGPCMQTGQRDVPDEPVIQARMS